jgi:hypothetical protein
MNAASLVRMRLGGDPADLGKSGGGGKGGNGNGGGGGRNGGGGLEWQYAKLLAPLFADDKVVRNRIKALKRFGKGGK